MDEINSVERKKFHIDDVTFWMLFSLFACIVIAWMAIDFHNAVSAQVESITIGRCNELLSNLSMPNILNNP